jgi:hypothetical protein
MGGYFGDYFGDYFGNWFGDSPAQTVAHPTTGNLVKVIEIAEATLRVVMRLLADYKTL